MVPTWLESILPGVRESRPTLVAGVMWTLVLGLVFHDQLASLTSGAGPIRDVFAAVSRSHALVQALVVGTLVFGVGAIASGPVDSVAQWVGAISTQMASRREWQQRAKIHRSKLEITVGRLEKGVSNDPKPNPSRDQSLRNEKEKLHDLRIVRRPLKQIRRTPANIKLIGPPDAAVERQIVFGAAADSAEKHFKANAASTAFDSSFQALLRGDHELAELASKLTTELQYSGDQLLRRYARREVAMDIDRHRAEARLHIALAAPVIAMSSIIAGVWGLAIGLYAFLTLLRSSIQLAAAGERTLQVLAVTDFQTPTITEAKWVGRERAQQELDYRAQA